MGIALQLLFTGLVGSIYALVASGTRGGIERARKELANSNPNLFRSP
jgi:hypothetical protein